MANIFTIDGEDAGSSPWEWSSIYNTAYGTFALDSNNPYEGTYAYRYTGISVNEDEYPATGYGQKNFVGEEVVYLVMRLYVPSTLRSHMGWEDDIFVFQILDLPGAKLAVCMRTNVSGYPQKWRIMDTGAKAETTDEDVTLNSYFILQGRVITGASGRIDVWVDGKWIGGWAKDYTGISLDSVRCGSLSSSAMEGTMDFDLIIAEDDKIAGYSWPEAPTSFRERARRYMFTTPRDAE